MPLYNLPKYYYPLRCSHISLLADSKLSDVLPTLDKAVHIGKPIAIYPDLDVPVALIEKVRVFLDDKGVRYFFEKRKDAKEIIGDMRNLNIKIRRSESLLN